MINDNNMYTIKEVAEQTGLSVDTLRFYERSGLIAPVTRNGGGHRRYSETDLRQISLLVRLRATGMSIENMQRYFYLLREGDHTIPERRVLMEAHRQQIQAQIDALCETRAIIDLKIERYLQAECEAVVS